MSPKGKKGSLAGRLLSSFREFGASAGLLYLIDRALQRMSPRLGLNLYELMVQPITDKALLPAGLAKNIEYREIREGDPEIALMPAREDIKEARFRQNAQCLGAYRKGQLIGYMWFCFDSYDEDEVRCTFVLPYGRTSVFDFDLYVMPERRLGIGFAAVWHGANRHLWERGVRHTFSRVSRFNTASRRSHAHLGGARVGLALFLKVRGVEFMCSTVSPYLGITFRGDQRLRFGLKPDVLLVNEGRSRAAANNESP